MEGHWTDDFFLDNPPFYLDGRLPDLIPEVTMRDVDGLVSSLNLESEQRILDLACGHGRHAVELARRGYTRITGLDYTPAYLEMARRTAEAAGVAVQWTHGDMRSLPYEGEFDAVYNILTSLFYFDDDTNQAVVNGIARALRPGGRFLVDINNPVGFLRRLRLQQWRPLPQGGWLLEDGIYNPRLGRVESRRTLINPDGRQESHDLEIRWYTAPELERMLKAAGLRLVELYGSLDLSPYTIDSTRLVAVAQK